MSDPPTDRANTSPRGHGGREGGPVLQAHHPVTQWGAASAPHRGVKRHTRRTTQRPSRPNTHSRSIDRTAAAAPFKARRANPAAHGRLPLRARPHCTPERTCLNGRGVMRRAEALGPSRPRGTGLAGAGGGLPSCIRVHGCRLVQSHFHSRFPRCRLPPKRTTHERAQEEAERGPAGRHRPVQPGPFAGRLTAPAVGTSSVSSVKDLLGASGMRGAPAGALGVQQLGWRAPRAAVQVMLTLLAGSSSVSSSPREGSGELGTQESRRDQWAAGLGARGSGGTARW